MFTSCSLVTETTTMRSAGHRGNDDGMSVHGDPTQHGKPQAVRVRDPQPDAREGQAGPPGVAERPVVPLTPGNSGRGKGPQFKANARSNRQPGDWHAPTTSSEGWEVADGVAHQSEELTGGAIRCQFIFWAIRCQGRWAVRHLQNYGRCRKRRQTKPHRNQRKACYRWRLSHRRPSLRVANEADPRRVVRFPTTLATIRSTRSRRQARATGELGAANVVLSFEQ